MDYPRAIDSSPEDRGLGVRDCVITIVESKTIVERLYRVTCRPTRPKFITCSSLLKTGCNSVVLPTLLIFVSGVACIDNWRGEYSYIRVHRP